MKNEDKINANNSEKIKIIKSLANTEMECLF
jgi:hypothetical protein